jgi:ABC-2 type transport system ATP-binding protein
LDKGSNALSKGQNCACGRLSFPVSFAKQRYSTDISRPVDHPLGSGMPNEVITINSLVKEYGPLRAVNGISFSVNRGEIFSLLGPNGAGKTTTVEIIEGLRSATSGTVSVMGLDPMKDRQELLRKVGIMPQDFDFIDLITPLEAVNFYLSSMGSKTDPGEILDAVELSDKKDSLFNTLSGGQKQKLGIAIALCNDPEILFLDEPTAGLDPVSRRNVWTVIEKMRKSGKTVFLTTHYLEEAEKLADRVAIVHNGAILDMGSPAELVDRHGSGSVMSITASGINAVDLEREGFTASEHNGNLEVSPIKNVKDFFRAVEYLKSRNTDVKTLNLKKESLEDVFIKMVGKEAEDES